MDKIPTCYLVSLKYAPGLWKELHVFGDNLSSYGYKVKYLVSKEYKWLIDSDQNNIIFISSSRDVKGIIADVACYPFGIRRKCTQAFHFSPPSFLCIYNPHPLNYLIFKKAKQYATEGIRLLYMHEPAKPNKKLYGWKGRIFFKVVEFTQKLALSETTDVNLPSPVAMDLFDKYYSRYSGCKHYAPILIPDDQGTTEEKRRYFSMVGRFNCSKRLDEFIDTINYSAACGYDLQFQIVTASPIAGYLKRLTQEGKRKTKIVVKNKISDSDISNAIVQSIAVLCLHQMVTQSGVVTVAFMNSTPIIARKDRGFTQHVQNGINGWILPKRFRIIDLVEAMKSVNSNFIKLSENARKSYLQLFSDTNWSTHYKWLLLGLKRQR